MRHAGRRGGGGEGKPWAGVGTGVKARRRRGGGVAGAGAGPGPGPARIGPGRVRVTVGRTRHPYRPRRTMDTPGSQPRWWHGATLYQIYVRSWQDTNDDGYGDLNGVTAHLDYLSWLGVDGIWLSPTMPSPDEDWGYDVSDYLGVHPELGTLADLDRLIAEAGQRDLRVLLDLVPEPHRQRAPLVRRGGQRPGVAAPRVLRLGRPGPRRRAAEQLAGRDGRVGLDARRGQRPVLPAQLPAQPARPELVEPGGAPGVPGHPAVLVRPGRGRVPDRRGPRALQGRPAPRRPAVPRGGAGPRPVRPGPGVQREPAGVARGVPGLAEDRRELPGAAGAARGDLGRQPGGPGRIPRPRG